MNRGSKFCLFCLSRKGFDLWYVYRTRKGSMFKAFWGNFLLLKLLSLKAQNVFFILHPSPLKSIAGEIRIRFCSSAQIKDSGDDDHWKFDDLVCLEEAGRVDVRNCLQKTRKGPGAIKSRVPSAVYYVLQMASELLNRDILAAVHSFYSFDELVPITRSLAKTWLDVNLAQDKLAASSKT